MLQTFTHEDQLQLALQLAEKEVRGGKGRTPAQIKQKIQDVLVRKGYSFTIVQEVLEQITIERQDEEWQHLIEEQGDKIWRKYAAKLQGIELHMKVKQALYQKGFPIEIINSYINHKEYEE